MQKLHLIYFTTGLFTPDLTWGNAFIFEGGALSTQKLVVSSGTNGNATNGWDTSVVPTVRGEYWIENLDSFDFGVTLAPLIFTTSGKLTNNLSVSGVTLPKDTFASFNFQFHNLRFSGNYPVLRWNDNKSNLRAGVTGILNYARLTFTSQGAKATENDFLAVPILRVDLSQDLGNERSLVIRGDFLPLSTSFDEGFFDFFLGMKFSRVEPGFRFFWGGFFDESSTQTSNATFFSSFVIRSTF